MFDAGGCKQDRGRLQGCAAAKNKWNVTIAVVDDGGFLVQLERIDGAPAQSTLIATGKAQTAAATRTPTKTLEDIVKDRPATVTFPGRVPVQGGLPITHQGECVGAVGVSGAKSNEDEQVASAGLKALAWSAAPLATAGGYVGRVFEITVSKCATHSHLPSFFENTFTNRRELWSSPP